MKHLVFRFSIRLLAVLATLTGVPSLVAAHEVISLDPPPEREVPAHIVGSWEVSPAIPVEKVQREEYPSFFSIFFTDRETTRKAGRRSAGLTSSWTIF